ncbi:CvpA family protein [Lachnospiraceae bacterium JLR.KK008]
MNIVFFVVLVLMIGGGVKGYKRGMVEEVNKTIAMILALTAIAMFVVAVKGYMDHEKLRTILGIVCMTIAVLVYRIADFLLSALKMISTIPVIRGVNKLLGFGVGVAEAVLLVWAGFVVIVAFEFGGVSEYILMNVKDNALLTYLFQHNYLAHFVADAMPVISAFSE